MTNFQYDLHTHTTTSDGKLHWKELLNLAKEVGLKGLAITDHNTLGPIQEISDEARNLGLAYIPATEIKVTCKKQIEQYREQTGSEEVLLPTQELIVYGIDPTNEEFLRMSNEHLQGKIKYVVELCRLLHEHSASEIPNVDLESPISIDAQEVIEKAGNYVGATHVLEQMIKQYAPHTSSGTLTKADVKKLVVDVQAEALKCMQDDPFYGLDIVDGLNKAREWGKVVVMAHPFTESRRDMANFYESFLVPLLAENGLHGLEQSYPEHNEAQMRLLGAMASGLNLLLTGGSDFHRKEDNLYRLGCCGVNRDTFLELERRVI
jgi:hypothetical protein